MTSVKSLLLGSAIALVVVAGAQAADLPAKKGAPAADYAKVCTTDGMTGFVIPGSETCLKISGTLSAHVEAGALATQYLWAGGRSAAGSTYGARSTYSDETQLTAVGAAGRPDVGYTARFNLALDAKTNTAYGVLTSHFDAFFDYGSGFDSFNDNSAYINHGYVNWAGITAGKANSFFSFFAGGDGQASLFSPDRNADNQPLLLAYAATLGGGLSATISLEDPALGGPSGPGQNSLAGVDYFIAANSSYRGVRSPDIVAALDLAQDWGGAHLASVAHEANMLESVAAAGAALTTWGWAIDGGLKVNLPALAASDNIQLQGSYSRNAVWYSGIPDAMWNENGQVNGNGVAMPVADAYYVATGSAAGSWATPTAWSLAALGEFSLGSAFSIDPEISYAQLVWSGLGSAGELSSDSRSWIGGAVFHWDPVAHLDFNIELLYQTTHQSAPGGWVGSAAVPNWRSTSSGLAGRLLINRDF